MELAAWPIMLQQLSRVVSFAGMAFWVTQLDLSDQTLGSNSGPLAGPLARLEWNFFFGLL